MGIHTWNRYFEYESKSLKSYIETIERFCSECHTNEDYSSCEKCPTGIFIGQLKKYLIEISEIMEKDKFREAKDEKTKIMVKIKGLLKKMPSLHPLYLPRADETNPNSVFNQLKRLSFELDLYEKYLEQEFRSFVFKKELQKLAGKAKDKKKLENKKDENIKKGNQTDLKGDDNLMLSTDNKMLT